MPKIKRDQIGAVLDALHEDPSQRRAAKINGLHYATIRRWRIAAEEGHPEFQEIEYGGVIQRFDQHLLDALDCSVEHIESELRSSSLLGKWVPVFHHGAQCWKEDERLVAMDPALREMLGYTDLYERDEQGNRVPLLQFVPASIDGIIKVLSSYSETYADKRHIKMDMNANLGVTVIGKVRPLAQVEVLREVAKIAAPTYDSDLEDLLGPEPVIDMQVKDTEPEPEIIVADEPATMNEEERTIRSAPTVAETPPPQEGLLGPTDGQPASPVERVLSGRPLTPMERDLLGRSRATPEERSRPIGTL